MVEGTVGSVMTDSPNPEVAIHFLRELVAIPEAQRAMARSGIRPVFKEQQALAIWRETVGDRNADAMELSLASTMQRVSWVPLNDALQPFFEGKAPLEPLLPSVKEKYAP